MKKFIIYLMVIVIAVSLGFAVFFLVRDNEVISISSATIYKDAGSQPFTIDVNHQNKKSYTKISVSVSDDSIVDYDDATNRFTAISGGVARVNFRTTNAKFRNLWCDVIVGDGTIESPYYISTPEQLAAIGSGVADEKGIYSGSEDFPQYTSNACYKLVADIDVKDVNGGYWIPLRNFSGRLDGNGFKISNINIDREKYLAAAEENPNTYDPTIFVSDNVGMFQKITATGMVYNLKLENFHATGIYTNFGTIAAINEGIIERIEVLDADLSVETKVFGGLVAINTTTETGENKTYERNIARIDRCSINLNAGKKTVYNPEDNTTTEAVLGMNGIIGGLVGQNQGGTIVYSYVGGNIAFAKDTTNAIVYGGLVATNRFITLTKIGGKYTTFTQGANIKDCYSKISTELLETPTNAGTRIAGAIGINTDVSDDYYEDDLEKQVVYNYIIGVYYNKDNLNKAQEGIEKKFVGIAEFICGSTTVPYTDEKMVVYGYTTAELKIADNFDSHTTYDIAFDENGQSLGVQTTQVKWLFGTVWSMDKEVNEGNPFLNYQLVYIPDDFRTAGTPIVLQNNRYTFEKGDPDFPITIVSGTNGRLTLMVGDTYDIKITPAGSKVTWVSSDTSTVAVDSATGKITAIKSGTATITATTKSGSTDSITVVVSELAYTITNYPFEVTIIEGTNYQLSGINVSPVTTLTYSTNDSAIATISDTGLITGVKPGTTIVNVIAGGTYAYIKVNVIANTPDIQSVVITLKNANINKTDFTAQYTGNIEIESAMLAGVDIKDQLTFKYMVVGTGASVVTVNETGVYTVVGTGEASVKVSVATQGYIGETFAYFTIKSQTGETLNFTHSSYTLYVGGVYQILYTGTEQVPTFTSDDDAIATVSASGKVTAVGLGTTTIRGSITREDGTISTATCTITVSANQPITITLSTITTRVAINTPVEITATASQPTEFNWFLSSSTAGVDTSDTIVGISEDGATITLLFAQVGEFTVTVKSTTTGASASMIMYVYDPKSYTRDIYTFEQLNSVRNYLNKDFRLCADIDMTGQEWTPIGDEDNPFSGTFTNAGSYTITNTSGAIFGQAMCAKISGINITNAVVSGTAHAGAIVGYALDTDIVKCTVDSVKISGTNTAGGIVGYADTNSLIENCNVKGNIEISSSKYAGGIVGHLLSSALNNCKVEIESGSIGLSSGVSGYAGGIVGYTNSPITNVTILKASISANNSDSDYAGGIAGYTTGTITIATVKNAAITGYYVGGIAGSVNIDSKATLNFSNHKNGLRKEDLSSSSYKIHISQVAVKDTVSLKGNNVGGLVGVLQSGTIANCYTRASIKGNAISAVMGGFAAYIYATSSEFKNAGGSGNVGIIENCYAACTFSGAGKKYSITASTVHQYQGLVDNGRNAGYCFNYVFDNDTDGNATFTHSSNVFASDKVQSKKSTAEMKDKNTYTSKGFDAKYWNLGSDYPTLKTEA